jgi:hydroxyethylthiazole kinase-like uncharacterized protein yjeF
VLIRRHPLDIIQLLPKRIKESYKGTYGKVLLIAGSNQYTGAAALMAEASLRSGVGLVYMVCTHLTAEVIRSRSPEVIVIESAEENGVFHKSTLDTVRDLISTHNFSAIGVGSGIGILKHEYEFYTALINLFLPLGCPILFDAEAMPPAYKFLLKNRVSEQRFVFTPHPKEFLRMINLDRLGDINKDVLQSSKQVNQTIVYKTHSTIIASVEGIWRCPTGSQALATAGSGDVLSGLIAGLMAQGLNSTQGSMLGVYLHGLIGELAEKKIGLRSVLARDLCDLISDAFLALGDHHV